MVLRSGSITQYRETDAGTALSGGLSVLLHQVGTRSWGFLEWPDEGLYGFFQAERPETGAFSRILQSIFPGAGTFSLIPGAGNLGAVDIRFRTGAGGRTLSLRFGGAAEHVLHAIGADGRLRVRSFSVGSGYRFVLDSIDAGGKTGSGLDALLRRGSTAVEYARERWNAEKGKEADIPPGAAFTLSWVERQTVVYASPQIQAVQIERYRFDGGAHGNTVAVSTVMDAEQLKVIVPADLFRDGWESPMSDLLHARALDALVSRGLEPLPQGKPGTLVGYGFFEEGIRPSSDMIVCRSGVGFHYDRYELAPYAWGDFLVIVPWVELGGLLREDLPAGIDRIAEAASPDPEGR